MSTLFKTFYTGTLSQFNALGNKEETALYFINDASTGVKSIYKGTKKVAGDFIIVNGTTPTTPEQGVIYYITEFGDSEPKKPFVGFHNGTKWIPFADNAKVEELEGKVTALEASVGKKGDDATYGEDGGELTQSTNTGLFKEVEDVRKNIKDTEKKSKITVEKLTSTPEGLEASYVIKQNSQQVGVQIDIPKVDKLLKTATIGNMDDTFNKTNGTITPSGSGTEECLHLVFGLSNGKFEKTSISLENFLLEAEAGDGISVENHIYKVNLDATKSDYIGFNEDKAITVKTVDVTTIKSITQEGVAQTEGGETVETGVADAVSVAKSIIDTKKETDAAIEAVDGKVGNLSTLETTKKDNLVNAINEINANVKAVNVTAEGDGLYVNASASGNKVTVEGVYGTFEEPTTSQTVAMKTDGITKVSDVVKAINATAISWGTL